jgi:hypothetical protein
MYDRLAIESTHDRIERLRADAATHALCATDAATHTAPAPRRHAARLARALAHGMTSIADALDGRRTAAA